MPLAFLLLPLAPAAAAGAPARPSVGELRTEYKTDAIGIDAASSTRTWP
jgi:hypothetical protein